MVEVADGAPGSAGVVTGAEEAATKSVDGVASAVEVFLWGVVRAV